MERGTRDCWTVPRQLLATILLGFLSTIPGAGGKAGKPNSFASGQTIVDALSSIIYCTKVNNNDK